MKSMPLDTYPNNTNTAAVRISDVEATLAPFNVSSLSLVL